MGSGTGTGTGTGSGPGMSDAGAPIGILVGSRERDAQQVKLKLFRENREVDVPRTELVTKIKELLGG